MSDFKQLRRWAEDWLGFAWIISLVVLTGGLFRGAHCQEPQSVLTDEEQDQPATSSADQHYGDGDTFLPQLPDAVTQLPVWADQTMPFDVDGYFAVPPTAKRAATKYLDALLEFSDDMESCFVEDRHAHAWVLKPEYVTRFAVMKVRSKWLYSFLERTNYENLRDIFDLEDLEELRDIVAEYEEGFRKLRDAQREEACTFEIAISPLPLLPHVHAARSVGWTVYLSVHRHLADGKLDAAIGDVEMLLRLARDLRPRGDVFCQTMSLQLEQWCWRDLLPHIISQGCLTIEHCDRILKLIGPNESEVDPMLEGEKYEQLFWRQLLYQLERNEYDVAARVREFDLRGSFIVPTMLSWELHSLGQYRINSNVVRQFAEDQADQDEKLKQLYEQIKKQENVNQRPPADANRMLAALMLTKALMEMPADGFRQDYAVLDQRYRQLEKAINVTYPERAEKLWMLRHWTWDDAWERAEVLRVFQPKMFSPELARLVTTQRRIMLCLLVLVRGRLAGVDESADLEQLVRVAGLTQAPLDPYSGVAFQNLEARGEYIVYSVGPDGDDDQARAAEFWGTRWPADNPPDGDISLSCTRPPRDGRQASSP